MSHTDQEKLFLIELEALTRKHHMAIGGCGCCGSPRIQKIEEGELDSRAGYGTNGTSEILWISPTDEYDWENYSSSIVKIQRH